MNTDVIIVKEVAIAGKQPTGKTVHYAGGHKLQPAVKLQIARYPEDTGFYLFHINEMNEVQTDTYHETMEEAMSQAAWEFDIGEDEWLEVRFL